MSDGLTERQDEFGKWEAKMDELNAGLLEAYAAGFAETMEIADDVDHDVDELMSIPSLQECHYYYWDGRTKPLEGWIREQFDLEAETDA